MHNVKRLTLDFTEGLLFSLVDSYGRYLFLKGNLGNMPCTLANIYAPNQDQAGFLSISLNILKDFAQGCIILKGDFNVPKEPKIDTSQGTSSISHKCLPLIHKCLLLSFIYLF